MPKHDPREIDTNQPLSSKEGRAAERLSGSEIDQRTNVMGLRSEELFLTGKDNSTAVFSRVTQTKAVASGSSALAEAWRRDHLKVGVAPKKLETAPQAPAAPSKPESGKKGFLMPQFEEV